MTVDLSKAVKGSKVKFRCGGEAVIDGAENPTCGLLEYTAIKFENCRGMTYHNDGTISCLDGNEHPFDIITIEPPEFDWSTVKPGMAFLYDGADSHGQSKGIVWFVALWPTNMGRRTVVVTDNVEATCQKAVWALRHENLTRAPEHDIEVQS